MKKIVYLVIILSIFILTGCTNTSVESEKVPVNLKVVTEGIVEANLNSDGNIIIEKDNITDKATYISYNYEGVTIGLIAVRDSSNNIQVVVNTCSSCGGSPYAYFVQVGDKLQCQNCGNLFDIDTLDNLSSDGCSPIGIVDRTDTDKEIIV